MSLTDEELKRIFSKRLTSIMEKYNINQVELSKILGVSESSVGKWLLQKAMPRMGVIQKLADHFNVGKSYFLEEKLHRNKEPIIDLSEEIEKATIFFDGLEYPLDDTKRAMLKKLILVTIEEEQKK